MTIAFRIPVFTRTEVEKGQIEVVVNVFSPQLILQFTKGVQWFYNIENYPFPRIQRGSNIFKGVHFFQGGPNANFYRIPYNL